jgi:hypothetical protein
MVERLSEKTTKAKDGGRVGESIQLNLERRKSEDVLLDGTAEDPGEGAPAM